ncbi:hypothetical protein OG943_32950 [Amycolatopsis sp. NBC_00345]|uniref:hypothetical protein n=1 Tax=Amycolatopsis sp. NBC_00345 TaxID=2975955 RepID=UPI002E25DB4D
MVRTLTARPTVKLGHLIGKSYESRFTGDVTKSTYRTCSLPERPDEGSRVQAVACEYCEELVGFRIYSIAGTVRLRRRWLVLGCVGLVVSGLAGADLFRSHPLLAQTAGLVVLSAALVALGLAAVIAGFIGCRQDDGVRLLSGRPRHNML